MTCGRCRWPLWWAPPRGQTRYVGRCGLPYAGWRLYYLGAVPNPARAAWLPVCSHHEPAELILAA